MARCLIINDNGSYVRTEERQPECGEAYCERCGECISCANSGCFYAGTWYEEHLWYVGLWCENTPASTITACPRPQAAKVAPRTRRGKLIKPEFVYTRAT